MVAEKRARRDRAQLEMGAIEEQPLEEDADVPEDAPLMEEKPVVHGSHMFVPH